ncbi:MAG: SGNH/GDSL hydrolase family protein [Oscillospiraceae bacterium]|nr:SGNH/GDSL hydrolase family protein [Oscillospiraceae bacterium]
MKNSEFDNEKIESVKETISKPNRKQLICKYLAVILVYTLVFLGLQRLFVPKFMSEVFDGALIGEYYSSLRNHSVIFIGDCEVYQNFSPPELFREHGITSHIRGAPSQTLWQSYWILRDTLRFAETPPEVVVLSVLAMRRGEPTSEPYNRLNIDGMRFSPDKFGAINSSMLEEESLISYAFPLFRYKDRWRELSNDDFRYFFVARQVGFNGYLMRSETVPVTRVPTPRRLDEYYFPDITWEYLERIRKLCYKNGIELVLTKAPTAFPHWHDGWDELIRDYADEHSLQFFSLGRMNENGELPEPIDLQFHTPNAGLHMNVFGAEILSRWLGKELRSNQAFDHLELPDHRNTAEIAKKWEQLIYEYDNHRTTQLAEFEQYGEIRTITR